MGVEDGVFTPEEEAAAEEETREITYAAYITILDNSIQNANAYIQYLESVQLEIEERQQYGREIVYFILSNGEFGFIHVKKTMSMPSPTERAQRAEEIATTMAQRGYQDDEWEICSKDSFFNNHIDEISNAYL